MAKIALCAYCKFAIEPLKDAEAERDKQKGETPSDCTKRGSTGVTVGDSSRTAAVERSKKTSLNLVAPGGKKSTV